MLPSNQENLIKMLYDSRLEVLKDIVRTKERLNDLEVDLQAIDEAIEAVERGK